MLVAVTGGNGFLGREVCRALSEAGHDLRILSRTGGPSAAGKEQITGSVESAADLDALLKGADAVMHLAGKVSRDPADAPLMHRLHVQASQLVLEKALEHKIKRFVLASTSGTVGVTRTGITVHDDAGYALEITSRWPYYLSKTYQEKAAIRFAEEQGMELFSIRPSLLLGPGDKDRSSTGDILNFLNGKIASRLNGGLSFVDVRDAAAVFVNAVEIKKPNHRSRTYLVGGPNLAMDDFFTWLERISGRPSPKMKLRGDLAVMGARLWQMMPSRIEKRLALDPVSVEMACFYWYIDSSRAVAELGFAPRPGEDTLADTVKDLRGS